MSLDTKESARAGNDVAECSREGLETTCAAGSPSAFNPVTWPRGDVGGGQAGPIEAEPGREPAFWPTTPRFYRSMNEGPLPPARPGGGGLFVWPEGCTGEG